MPLGSDSAARWPRYQHGGKYMHKSDSLPQYLCFTPRSKEGVNTASLPIMKFVEVYSTAIR